MSQKIKYRNLPQLFLKARANLISHFRPIWGHFGLTDQQWRILRVLDESGAMEPRELCGICQISSPSMAGVLKRMEEADLIFRSPVSGDQRRILIALSAHGDKLISRMAPLIDEQYRHIEKAFGVEAINDLIAALEKFNQVDSTSVKQVSLDKTDGA